MRSQSLSIYGTVWAVILAWAVPSSQAQIPEGWEIVEIFPAGTEYNCGRPDINNRGQIVFDRRLWPSDFDREIMLYDQGELVQLTFDDVWDAFPRINNHGEIVWQRDLDPDPEVWHRAIVRWRDGIIETVAEPEEGFYLAGPDINDVGHIVWTALPTEPSNIAHVLLWDGRSATQITNDTYSNQGPRINASSQIVWTRYDFRGNWRSAIMLYDRGFKRQLSDGLGQPQFPHISDAGDVVWADSSGVYLWVNGLVTPIMHGTAIFTAVNSCQEVAFSRLDEVHGNRGLWLIRDEAPIEIVDSAFGSTAEQINAMGEIVFQSGRSPTPGMALFRRRPGTWDLDFDGDMDLYDHGMVQQCLAQSEGSESCQCRPADADRSGKIDVLDWGVLWETLSGPK